MKKIITVCLLFCMLALFLPVFASCGGEDVVTLYVYN